MEESAQCLEISDVSPTDAQRLVDVLHKWAHTGVESCARVTLCKDSMYFLSNAGDEDCDWVFQIPASKHLIIEANGSSFQRVESQDQWPQKSYLSFFLVRGSLEIHDLILTNGQLHGKFGGAIAALPGSSVSLKGCIIDQCRVSGAAGKNGEEFGASGGGGGQGACGGAIYCYKGSLLLENCTLKRNCAQGGAGGDAFPNNGRFGANGGAGGGIRGGQGGSARGQDGEDAGQVQTGEEYTGSFGGGGGSSSGSCGSNGGNGLWGGGGGGAGAKTIGGWEGVGKPGKGGFGAGNGGMAGASAGSAGGGGGAFGGAICVIDGRALRVKNCTLCHNSSQYGKRGKHTWGWNSGRDGTSYGGAIFVKGTPIVEIENENTERIAKNEALEGNNVYHYEREKEAYYAPVVLCKNLSQVPDLIATSVQRNGGSPESILPGPIIDTILQEYVGWCDFGSDPGLMSLFKKAKTSVALTQ
mmetsp:Transcript_9913/g.19459  ORF Transcript_9913/g.19459 Transcript_9913/m.19459 type:complete len:470 (+) Transcript_9913:360-1769(+)